jgi:hypothetical protein
VIQPSARRRAPQHAAEALLLLSDFDIIVG